jgi:response regulator RpfG family c-di-GMP phosphodiesterase
MAAEHYEKFKGAGYPSVLKGRRSIAMLASEK